MTSSLWDFVDSFREKEPKMQIERKFIRKSNLWSCDECGFMCNRKYALSLYTLSKTLGQAVAEQHELMCPAKFTPYELSVSNQLLILGSVITQQRKLTITTKSDRYVWEGQNTGPKKYRKFKQNKTVLTDRTNQLSSMESVARQPAKKAKLVEICLNINFNCQL